MGETALVMMPALTSEKIAAGEAFLRHLDDQGIRVVAAFWFFHDEGHRWELILASPEEAFGVYDKLDAFLETLGQRPLKFTEFSVRSPSDPLVNQYGRQVWRGRLPKNMIEHIDCGTYFIYRFLPLRFRSR